MVVQYSLFYECINTIYMDEKTCKKQVVVTGLLSPSQLQRTLCSKRASSFESEASFPSFHSPYGRKLGIRRPNHEEDDQCESSCLTKQTSSLTLSSFVREKVKNPAGAAGAAEELPEEQVAQFSNESFLYLLRRTSVFYRLIRLCTFGGVYITPKKIIS